MIHPERPYDISDIGKVSTIFLLPMYPDKYMVMTGSNCIGTDMDGLNTTCIDLVTQHILYSTLYHSTTTTDRLFLAASDY